MDKTTFIKLMKEFISLRKDEENLDNAFKLFDPDFGHFTLGRYENLFVKTISEAMNDKYENISYWIYDCNMGKDAKKDSVTDKNGKGIPIKTLSNLYDLITKYKD